VHALGQVVSFRASAERQPNQVRDGLNSMLPPQIACLRAEPVSPEFHAQKSAVGKLYRYVLRVGPCRTALRRDRCWQVRYPLDLDAMGQALSLLVGRHDFTSFRAAGCSAKSPVREVSTAEIRPMEDAIWIELYGEGFLRHMVRNIVGSLHEIGRHNRPPSWFSELLEARDRTQAGVTAPPQGLFLVRVDYPGFS
jgi:tRNA pseudouridine38-40 synthase